MDNKMLVDTALKLLGAFGSSEPGGELPALQVAGSKIKDKDTQKDVLLNGVTTDYFRKAHNWIDEKELLRRIAEAKSWGANSIQIYIDPLTMEKEGMQEKLDKVVNWVNQNRMYATLVPVNDKYWDNGYPGKAQGWEEVDKKVTQLQEDLAKTYGKNKNVVFGLEAEPKAGRDTFDEVTRERMLRIRKHAPDSLVIAPLGSQQGASLTYPLNDKNIAYEDHDYKTRNMASDVGQDPMKKMLDAKTGKQPFVVGEYGGYWGGDFGSQPDLDYIKYVNDMIRKKGVSSYSYALDQSNPGISLFDHGDFITERGKVAKKHLENYKPAQAGILERALSLLKFNPQR